MEAAWSVRAYLLRAGPGHPPPNERSVLCIGGWFITCLCGEVFELTGTQFDDFDCGMMGFLKCKCGNIIMPHCEERKVQIKEEMAEGDDPGWT